MLKLQGYGCTDLGQVRSNNEDAFWVDNALGVFIVCDGMGGHAAGEVASKKTIEFLHEDLLSQKETLASLDPEDMGMPDKLGEIAHRAV